MLDEARQPDLSFVVPAANENRWSDLLASLVATDPTPMSDLIGGHIDEVRREVVAPGLGTRRSDRLDLLLLHQGKHLAIIEAKVLADLGSRQLHRYETAFPDAEHRFVLHLATLPLSLRDAPNWRSTTWEHLLDAFAASDHPWVATTAAAWLTQLDTLVPKMDADTVWNDVPDDAAGFELALRARVAWLAGQMDGWCGLEHEMSQSSGGGAWAVTMRKPAPTPDHYVLAELQEGLPAQAWRPDPERPYRDRMAGPTILVGLSKTGSSTSADFDWRLLGEMFRAHVDNDARKAIHGRPWQRTSANPRDPIDRANWKAAQVPPWIGKGYGMATAKTHGVCAFGARIQLDRGSTLGEIDAAMRELQLLVEGMS